MYKFILLFISFNILTSIAQNNNASKETKFPEAKNYVKKKITYKIIDGQNHTYGYDIYVEGKLFIHQPSIPAMSGNNGFKTKANAEAIAKLAIQKIHRGEMPPSISESDLNKLIKE